jgi:hypothetical protein
MAHLLERSKTMKTFSIAVLLISWTFVSQAQGYFPLQIGNIWQYSSVDIMNPDMPLESKIIGDTLLPNGKSYSILTGLTFSTNFLRQEGSKVYGYDRTDSAEYILLDYAANLGDTLSHHSKGQRTNIAGGKHTYPNTSSSYWVFYEQAGPGNTLYNWTIKDSIGLTAITLEPGNSWNLSGALINGKLIGIITGIHSVSSDIPTNQVLKQNFPNPFNPTTIIQFVLSKSDRISLRIFNTLGQEVAVVANGIYSEGNHSVTWDASRFSSGIYFYCLETSSYKESKKMSLIH